MDPMSILVTLFWFAIIFAAAAIPVVMILKALRIMGRAARATKNAIFN